MVQRCFWGVLSTIVIHGKQMTELPKETLFSSNASDASPLHRRNIVRNCKDLGSNLLGGEVDLTRIGACLGAFAGAGVCRSES